MNNLDMVPTFKIHGENFLSEIHHFDRQLLFMRRHQQCLSKSYIDTYASNWFLGILSTQGPGVKVVSGQNEITLNPGTAIFLPPFSIVEWKTLSQDYEWYAYMGDFDLPIHILNQRFAFTVAKMNLPRRTSDFRRWLEENYKNSIYLLDQREPNAIAERLKKMIDQSFQSECLITQVSEDLKISRVVLTRAFKKSYGLSPVQYRNMLRIFDGLKLFSKFKNVSDIYYSSDFCHRGQFIKNFRQYLGVNPKFYNQKNTQPRN